MDTIYHYHNNQKELVRAFEELDFSASGTIMQLGHHAQVNISTLSESVLGRTKSLRMQEIYSTLEQTIDELMKLQDKTSPGKWHLPFTRRRAKDLAFLNWCRDVEARMDVVSDRLREHQVYLMKNIVMFDEYSRMNRANEAELEEAVLIGRTAIAKLDDIKQFALKENLEISPNEIELYLTELDNQRDRIDKRIQELYLSRQVLHQLDEQILILKHNEQTMADKIHSVLWNTMVLWKNQIGLMMEQGHIEARDYVAIDQRNQDLIDHLSEMLRLKKEDDKLLEKFKNL